MNTIVEFPDRRVVAEQAAQWLIRLDADTPPSPEELQALGEWLHRSRVHRDELEKLARLWGRMNVLTELTVPLGNANRPTARARGRSLWRRSGLLATSFASVLALCWVLLAREPAMKPLSATNGLYATAVGQQEIDVLADGSQVVLNTNSQIKVDYGNGYRRVHLLQGEALFTVAKDAKRPFRVYAGNRRIEAVGTAFSVYLKGENVSVAVTEGRVSLAAAPSRPTAAQLRADVSTFELDDSSMETLGTLDAGHVAEIRHPIEATAADASPLPTIRPVSAAELTQRLAWREGTLIFSGETLEQVVAEFSRYTNLSIEIPDASVRKLRIGGRFPAGETETMLATLQSSFNLTVTRLGHDRVVIAAAE
jgi:transmembrane sensor